MTAELAPLPCPHCEKPLELCICEAISPVENNVFVLILRHPQEQDEKLGTARLATLQLTNSMLKTGLSWPSLTKIMGRPVDPKRWGILYLGTSKGVQLENKATLTVVNRKGGPAEDQAELLENLEGIIALDGSWAQAKALWWRNAWMLKCRRLVLHPPRPSLYGILRKEPRRESVSTIESIAYSLAVLEHNKDVAEQILVPFSALLKKVRTEKSAPKTKPEPTTKTES
jgi:hypothetical protein